MGTFVTQVATPDLYLTKVPAPGSSIPPGLTVANVVQAVDMNGIEAALLDCRTSIRADVFNVMHFGAVGNGVADDSGAIQAALSAVTPGGTVYFPVGTYRVPESVSGASLLLTTSGVRLLLETGAVLQLDGSTASRYLLEVRASNVKISGGSLRGTWTMAFNNTDSVQTGKITNQELLRWLPDAPGLNYEDLTVEGVRFERAGDRAIHARMAGGGTLKGLTVRGCAFAENFSAMLAANFTLGGLYFERLTLEGNHVDVTAGPLPTTKNASLGGNALTTWGSFKQLRVLGNYVTNAGRMALEIWHDQPWIITSHNELVEIRGNYLGPSTYRTYSVGGNRVTCEDNVIFSGADYVECWGSDYAVCRNTVVGGGVFSAHANSDLNAGVVGRRWVIRDNVITSVPNMLEQGGVHLTFLTGLTVEGNSFDFSHACAVGTVNKRPVMYTRFCEDVKVTGNTVKCTGTIDRVAALQVTDVRGGAVQDNMFDFTGLPDSLLTSIVQLTAMENVDIRGNRTVSNRAVILTSDIPVGQAQAGGNTLWMYQWTGASFTTTQVTSLTSTVPGAPAVGAVYVVGDSPSGAWAGQARTFAVWSGAVWAFYPVLDAFVWNSSGNFPISNPARLPSTGSGTDSYLLFTSNGQSHCAWERNDFAARNRVRGVGSATNSGIYAANGWFWDVRYTGNVDWVALATAALSFTDILNPPSAAAPTVGRHSKGARARNFFPAVGQPKGWVCTVDGVPGTWVSEGNL